LDPAATHDLALQLSVAGVAGMLVLADPLRDFLPRPLPRIPLPGRIGDLASRIAEHAVTLACATLAATLCTGPLIAAAFHRAALLLAGFPSPLAAGARPLRPPARTRVRRAGVPACALLCLGFANAATPLFTRDLRITFLAVGQGDAAPVQFPGGRAMLIDGGG